MPGVGCNALNGIQLVAGCDVHNQIPPPPPIGPLPAPHAVAYVMGLAFPSTSKMTMKVFAGWGPAIGRQHDLGIGLYHFAANALLPLVWAGASNKAEFGVSTVQIPTGRMAVALIPVAGLNLQLDCNDVPCPAPTSMCVASFNTVTAGFTWADCGAGFASMAFDAIVTYVISNVVGKAFAKVFFPAMGALAKNFEAVFAFRLAHPSVELAIQKGLEQLVGWTVSTPLGYSFDTPWNKWGNINDSINDWISPPPAPPPPTPPP
jgi:hypothetical protein